MRGAAKRIRAALLAHYDEHARDLPWRHTDDPYAIWVSEVMLQQTQVRTAIPFYTRWMARFPTVDSLAAADLESVLETWAGLGYYSRARNLHRAAKLVRERHGGRLPRSTAGLRELPGVGAYTAGAVSSIAFGHVEPAVDGNVRRVLSRLFDLEHPTPGALAETARELLDPLRPGDSNQALMELGATLCRPRNPACGDCPVASACLALRRGTTAERPRRTRRAPVPEVQITAFVAVDSENRTLLMKRPQEGLLGGMWEFPSVEGPALDSALAPVTHRFTHLLATYHPVVVEGPAVVASLAAAGWPERPPSRPTRVLPLAELAGHAVPVGQLKIAAHVMEIWGSRRT